MKQILINLIVNGELDFNQSLTTIQLMNLIDKLEAMDYDDLEHLSKNYYKCLPNTYGKVILCH